nr:hypothetical protein [Streptomyces sp. DSM 41633]
YAPPAPTAEPVKPKSAAPYVAVAATVAIGIPVTMLGMAQPKYAPQEYGLGAVLNPDPYNVTERKAIEHQIARTFKTERQIAQYLENLDLPDSSVITDTVYGFGILAASSRPRVFVIPSDPDFTELLN